MSSKIRSVNRYFGNVYTKVNMHDLILLGIYYVTKKGETCTFERLVAECFNKFSRVFGFKRYPHWPDSLKFDRPLRTLRKKGFIIGSPKISFRLTKFGEKRVEEILNQFKKGSVLEKDKKTKNVRSADDKLIEYVKESQLYKDFLKNPENFIISEPKFRELLRCTMETPDRIIKQNLEYYKNVAEEYRETKIKDFLTRCEMMLFQKDG